jgi:hypothetical protein
MVVGGTAIVAGSDTLEEDGGCMDEVNVAVVAPILGQDLSFISDVGPRVRVFDANFAVASIRVLRSSSLAC